MALATSDRVRSAQKILSVAAGKGLLKNRRHATYAPTVKKRFLQYDGGRVFVFGIKLKLNELPPLNCVIRQCPLKAEGVPADRRRRSAFLRKLSKPSPAALFVPFLTKVFVANVLTFCFIYCKMGVAYGGKMSKTVSDLVELITEYYPKLRKVFRNLVSIKDVPISLTQLTCLNVIDKQNLPTMSELAEALSMSNQQLTKVVDGLEDLGMAERVYNESNRRKIYAKVTPKGKQTLEAFKSELDRKLGRLLGKISDDETDKLYYCVAHIATYFGYKEQ